MFPLCDCSVVAATAAAVVAAPTSARYCRYLLMGYGLFSWPIEVGVRLSLDMKRHNNSMRWVLISMVLHKYGPT